MNCDCLRIYLLLVSLLQLMSCRDAGELQDHVCVSGVYPHLAFYNNEAECGTGAVVPWAGSLWAVTYAPHSPYGSSDKLYEITGDLKQVVRSESIGGTPADRLIHRESNQLFIGPYAIDGDGNVRALSYYTAPGRYTGAARHLTDPGAKIYIATMEEGFYEVEVDSLRTTTLWSDDNVDRRPEGFPVLEERLARLPGWHGKGLYSGQGVLVFSNNGERTDEALDRFDVESGSLCEWNGKEWTVIRRNQFTEVTGPGGIYGNPSPESDPIWSIGFDYKSLILAVRDMGQWMFYRLPKASYCYDGAHGWNTEWPRIRNVGSKDNPDYLMTMHGMFWRFPGNFKPSDCRGIRPRSAYLKVIGDFTRWGDKLVLGCDDSAQKEFLNTRKAKGHVGGPGQSNSNLWFMEPDDLDRLGPNHASGYVWLREKVNVGDVSEPFLFAGWTKRCAWIRNSGNEAVKFTIEVDEAGTGKWRELRHVMIAGNASRHLEFAPSDKGEWIRVMVDRPTTASVGFVYGNDDRRTTRPDRMFDGLAALDHDGSVNGGLLWGLGQNRRALGMLANRDGTESGYYEMDDRLTIVARNDTATAGTMRTRYAIEFKDVMVEEGSVLVVDDKNRRWRLPLGDNRFTPMTERRQLRICREVATERDLFNCHGTFYELPAENADGYAKIRPIASHNLVINDYASYRGLLVMTGVKTEGKIRNSHIIRSEDGRATVWAGVIDDLWKLGKPVGRGGPWVRTDVIAGQPSDPYLIGFYDKRTLFLSHNGTHRIILTAEIDPTGDGEWMKYCSFEIEPGETLTHEIPDPVMGRWIRFTSDSDANVTTWLEYR